MWADHTMAAGAAQASGAPTLSVDTDLGGGCRKTAMPEVVTGLPVAPGMPVVVLSQRYAE